MRIDGWRRGASAVVVAMAAPILIGCGAADSGMASDASDTVAEAADPRDRFVGTWRLVRTERYDQRGDRLSDLMHPTIGLSEVLGYLMCDGERMGMIVQQADRPLDDVQAAVEGYTAYFGTYDVNETGGYVRHRIAGSLNPRLTGTDLEAFYEFSDDQLILTPGLQCPDSYVTGNGCAYGTTGIQLRLAWDRVPPAPTQADAAPLYGFWAIDRVERQSLDGSDLPVAQHADGYVAYMPSGQMAVQLMRPDRRRYEGPRPTVPEAEAAIETYFSYFGPFSIQPDGPVVVHHRAGHLDPEQVDTDAPRGFTLRDDGKLVLQPPVSTDAEGRESLTTVFWTRLAELDPAAVGP